MARMCEHISRHVARCREVGRLLENTKKAVARDSAGTTEPNISDFIAFSPAIRDVLYQADRVASTDSTILIMGETGVGKELLAKRIHAMSQRVDESFIVVDATTIPENLVESELFGHEKGAFTGADRRKIGRIELADKGTLFIDEVGEMPLTTQVKLLRVIQEKSFVRIGGTIPISSNFRLVVATNRDLEAEVRKGAFRKDLFFRLNTIPLTLPPLRDRKEDIVELTRHFLERFSRKYTRSALTLSPEEEEKAKQYYWPGNIRELQNVTERSVILAEGGRLELNLSCDFGPSDTPDFSEVMTLDELQRRYIKFILNKTGGKLSGPGSAAELLGIHRGTLYSRMKKLGLS
ncbi:MAG: sigma-54-dependent Fis family transcriptional regulator [Deltaproteobacteria bacterium]|nr:sigma-54-dependent Fis family transcriptional regulator [Deltaproteobacteria bacterium]